MTLYRTQTDTVTPGPPAYERFFVASIGRPVAADLVAAAQLQTGEHVLDVASGTGIVARLAADKVGPAGAVSGVDIVPSMIAEAKKACADLPNISWYEADAAALPMPDRSFDVVLCQMGLQFFPGKLPALKEMRRVLRPGGRVLINTPGPTPGIFVVVRDALARHVGNEAAGFIDTVFAMHDPDELTELLRSAGFSKPDVHQCVKTLDLPAPAEFLWQYLQSTPIGADVFAKTDEATRAALTEYVCEGCRHFENGNGMLLEVGLTTAEARKQ